jgi:hypothetical protein
LIWKQLLGYVQDAYLNDSGVDTHNVLVLEEMIESMVGMCHPVAVK